MFDRRLSPQILPPLNATYLELDHVGISYAFFKRWNSPRFVDSTVEDYNFLVDFCNNAYGLCTLAPSLLYFVRGFGKHLPLAQGTYVEQISCAVNSEVKRRLIEAGADCHALQPNRGSELFMYTEMTSPFFGWNVQALNASIAASTEQGCRLPRGGPFHVIFDALTPPCIDHFIQVQMEQPETKHFTNEYIAKMQQSKQVWAMTKLGQRSCQNM